MKKDNPTLEELLEALVGEGHEPTAIAQALTELAPEGTNVESNKNSVGESAPTDTVSTTRVS